MSQPIRFYYRGALQQVCDAAPTRTVLQHLREHMHCTGTKEGCAEGDCGACMVIIGSLQEGKVEFKAVNSCIQLLPTLDGRALLTVEDVQPSVLTSNAADGAMPATSAMALHPVQQAMVECHASQCGFCTPGFVMSLWALYLEQDKNQDKSQGQGQGQGQVCAQPAASAASAASAFSAAAGPLPRSDIDAALSGNLCRCTGYRPIIAAARRIGELPRVSFDRTALALQLQALQREACTVHEAHGQRFHAPRTVAELVQLRADHPDACLLAGGTDVGLWVTKQLRELGDIIYLGQVGALRQMREVDGMLEIGAGVSLETAYRALCQHYPAELTDLWQRFASQPIRNVGTLGGNVANGSPIGDSMPWLIALGAQVVLQGSQGVRVLALEDFYLGYQHKDLRPDEFVLSVRVPLPRENLRFRTYKLAKRFDQDISAVCAAFAITFDSDRDGETIVSARIAFGGMAGTPQRAANAEAALTGQPWTEAALAAAMDALENDYTPLSDMRASNTYRMQVAKNLLRRFWLETRTAAPLTSGEVNAFAPRA